AGRCARPAVERAGIQSRRTAAEKELPDKPHNSRVRPVPLSPEGAVGRERGSRGAQERRLRGHRARHRLLRHVGVVRLQAGAPRGVEAHRRARAAAGAGAGARRAGDGERFLVPRADRVARRPADAAPGRGAGAEMSVEALIFLALVCLLAGWVHGALGFGFPLVATPLAALMIDMKSAITLLAPVTLVLVILSALRGGRLG